MDTFESARPEPGSFRDPSGFIFWRAGQLYRQVNRSYRENYNRLMQSGLYEELTRKGWLIAHTELGIDQAASPEAHQVIRPERVPFVSYPYEWCFSQLKQAALLTLEIQSHALQRGLTLKDGSAYNVQFVGSRPIFIDTLSFEPYREGRPWVAYRQFCQHFLAPLALMSKVDVRLGQLLRVHLDGIPLDLASALLPWSTRFNFGLTTHLHLHAQAQKRYAGVRASGRTSRMSPLSLLGLIDSLRLTIEKLNWQPTGTAWAAYYDATNYNEAAFEEKKRVVSEWLDRLSPRPAMVWDLGANTGMFSRLASQRDRLTIAFDVDAGAVERNFLECRSHADPQLLPLLLDLTNPSPGLGWENHERQSLSERGPADVVLALALVHHLAISNNLPFSKIAQFFSHISHNLIIEFVSKSDSQAQQLLMNREDIFANYSQQAFERDFSEYFVIRHCRPITATERILYLMSNRSAG